MIVVLNTLYTSLSSLGIKAWFTGRWSFISFLDQTPFLWSDRVPKALHRIGPHPFQAKYPSQGRIESQKSPTRSDHIHFWQFTFGSNQVRRFGSIQFLAASRIFINWHCKLWDDLLYGFCIDLECFCLGFMSFDY